jgi:hypothetical protein
LSSPKIITQLLIVSAPAGIHAKLNQKEKEQQQNKQKSNYKHLIQQLKNYFSIAQHARYRDI